MSVQLPISARDVVRFTPDDVKDHPDPPIYLIGVPSYFARAAWRRDVKGMGAQYHGEAHRFAVMRKGIAEMASEAQREELLAIVDAAAAAQRDAPLPVAAGDEPEKLRRLGEILRQNYPPYAELLADRDYWLSIAPLMAARRFLRGWENVAAPFEQQFGLVPEPLLELLSEAHVYAIGWHAIGLMTLDKAAEKNSASPPPSLPSPTSTNAASAPPTARPGKSTASDTSATPAS